MSRPEPAAAQDLEATTRPTFRSLSESGVEAPSMFEILEVLLF